MNYMTSEAIEQLCQNKLEYLYLVSLISSDRIVTKEDAEKGLIEIEVGENAVKNANISDKKKQEFYDYFRKGREILMNDMERFRQEEK